MDFDKGWYDRAYKGVLPQEKLGVQRSYLNLIKPKIKTFRNILDVGCGYGDFLHICDLEGYETYGIEVSNFAIGKATDNTKAKIYNIDITKNRAPFGKIFLM